MANTHYLIASYTVGSGGTGTISFTSIPQTYTDLKLSVSARGNNADIYDVMAIKFNGSSTGYSGKYIQATGTSASSGNQSPGTYVELLCAGATTTANILGNTDIYIPNYTSSNPKSLEADNVVETNAATIYSRVYAGLWSGTSAITSIDVSISPSFGTLYSQYSTFYLYGIKNS